MINPERSITLSYTKTDGVTRDEFLTFLLALPDQRNALCIVLFRKYIHY